MIYMYRVFYARRNNQDETNIILVKGKPSGNKYVFHFIQKETPALKIGDRIEPVDDGKDWVTLLHTFEQFKGDPMEVFDRFPEAFL